MLRAWGTQSDLTRFLEARVPNDTRHPALLWISKRYAVNLANVSTVFRGTHGEIQITFIGGPDLNCSEKDLSPEAAAILLPDGAEAESHLQLTT